MGKAARVKGKKKHQSETTSQAGSYQLLQRPPLWRRFAAMSYDALLLLSLWMTLTFLVIKPLGHATTVEQSQLFILPLIILGTGVFYCAFWYKGGQTLGMRAWRLKVQTLEGNLISWPQSIIRSVSALLGLGNLVVLVDFKNKKALQDYISKTEVIALTKEENRRIYSELD